jgi:hypothetical protein
VVCKGRDFGSSLNPRLSILLLCITEFSIRRSRATVRIIDGVNHMGIVGDRAAVSIVADDVATKG